ncbi:MAG: hypothetical protein ACR2PS_07520 [Pseudomonadales bacterium]
MNSKSLQYANSANSTLEKFATAQTNFVTAIIRKVSDYLARSEIEQAQAYYKMKRNHGTQTEQPQDIVSALPIEEKLRLGMYHYMQ